MDTVQPTISVIICTWNRCALMTETLHTLRSQQYADPAGIEVIIVDNNSTDETSAVVAAARKDWTLGELRYIHENRQGKQFALNSGIRASRGQLLVFTDDDVVLLPDWLKGIHAAFAESDLELAGGRTLVIWPDGAAPRWFTPSMLAVVAGVDLGERRLQPPPANYAPGGTNLIVRASLFKKVGMFSETHFRHMDYEFGIRAARGGAKIAYIPDLIVYTKVPSQIINKRYFRRWYYKLGIAAAMNGHDDSTRLFLVPRWMWRRLLTDWPIVSASRLAGLSDRTFERELRVRQIMGYIMSSWRQRMLPGSHARWVERWSQKRDNAFH